MLFITLQAALAASPREDEKKFIEELEANGGNIPENWAQATIEAGMLNPDKSPTALGMKLLLQGTNLGVNFDRLLKSQSQSALFKLVISAINELSNKMEGRRVTILNKEGANSDLNSGLREAVFTLEKVIEWPDVEEAEPKKVKKPK